MTVEILKAKCHLAANRLWARNVIPREAIPSTIKHLEETFLPLAEKPKSKKK